jgi:hypothetical protein
VLGPADHHVADALPCGVSTGLGDAYLLHAPCTPLDRLVLEDLGPTTLVNARFDVTGAMSVVKHGDSLDLGALPGCGLESSSDEQRQLVADLVASVAH